MRIEDPDTTVLHFSDMHFNEPEVFEPVYGSEEAYREHASAMLDELAEGIDTGWFSGDCGDEQDWDELRGYMDRFDDAVMVPGNSDDHGDMTFYEHDDDGIEPEDLLENTRTDQLDIEDGPTYDILRSHVPQHVGVRPGVDPDRAQYLEPEENDKDGTMEAADDQYDIVVTAHYHGEGSFVTEDGTLVLQAGSTAQTYITGDELPDTSVQRLAFDDDEIHIEHIDFETGDVLEQRGYRFGEDGFTELYRDSPWTVPERYGRDS